MVALPFPVVVHAHAPATEVVAHGHVAVHKIADAVVGRSHRRESLGRLLLRHNADDAARPLRVVLRVRGGHDVDALHVSGRDAPQTVERRRHAVHEDEHIAVAAYRHLAAAVDGHSRRTPEHFEHRPRSAAHRRTRVDACPFRRHALRPRLARHHYVLQVDHRAVHLPMCRHSHH